MHTVRDADAPLRVLARDVTREDGDFQVDDE